MSKQKDKKPRPDKYAEKVAINVTFGEAMKMLAVHANTKGTKKITYDNRNSTSL